MFAAIGSCDALETQATSTSSLNNKGQCEAVCSIDDECAAFVFDEDSSTCYTFGGVSRGSESLPTWSDFGPGCCGIGAVLRNQTLTSSSSEGWLGECKQLCEESADCGFINMHPSGVCIVFRSNAPECAPPLTTDGLICGGGWEPTHTGDHGVHTYRYVKPSHVCHIKAPSNQALCSIERGWHCEGGSNSQSDR